MTQLEVPDYDLGLRGKLVRSEKLDKHGRAAFCTIVYGLDVVDSVVDTPLASAANGYPDAFAIPDESTRVPLPWRRETDAVIADMCDSSGVPLQESPRTVLQRVVRDYTELQLVPVLGFEYECYVLHGDDTALREHDYGRVHPLGRVDNAYSVSRITESADLFGEFSERMESVNIPVEACHSELGPGFFEFALAPMDALEAADSAVRARQYFRDLCAERGLLATFMAKLRMEASGSGGHVHQSVTRDGVNVFSDGAQGLSDEGRHYLGGLLATMGHFCVLFNPLLNSYKRLDAGSFVAERATWGWDNRNAACRVVSNAGPSAARIEHRRPGADANPYLVAAGTLAGGLHGLRERLEPGEALQEGADVSVAGGALPRSLVEATELFRGSGLAGSLLNPRFVECYAATRDAETAAFDKWWSSSITDWELRRYLEHL
jgi:glutamine synthetase